MPAPLPEVARALVFESAGRLEEAAAVYALMVERLDVTPPGDGEPQSVEEFERALSATRRPRHVTTPLLWPAVAVGLLLVLLSVWLLVRDVLRRRKGLDEEWHPVTTGAIPAVLAQDVDAIAHNKIERLILRVGEVSRLHDGA